MKTHPLWIKKLTTIVLAVTAGFSALWLMRSPFTHFLAWISDRQAVTISIQHFGVWGPAMLFLLLVLQVFVAVIPGHALMLAGSYVYGFAFSLVITISSTVLSSQVAFLIARWLGRRVVYRLARAEVIERWDRLAAHQGILFYFFSFVLPIFPNDLMCYVAGLSTISPRRFFVSNLLGRLACGSFITLIGSHGFRMPIAFWAATGVVLAAFFLAWRIYQKHARDMGAWKLGLKTNQGGIA